MREQPAVDVAGPENGCVLCTQPTQVGATDRGDVVSVATLLPLGLRAQQPFRGEQRHLGVVGDRAHGFVGREEAGDAGCADARTDVDEPVELDRRTERVPDRAAEDAADESLPGSRHERELRVEMGHPPGTMFVSSLSNT